MVNGSVVRNRSFGVLAIVVIIMFSYLTFVVCLAAVLGLFFWSRKQLSIGKVCLTSSLFSVESKQMKETHLTFNRESKELVYTTTGNASMCISCNHTFVLTATL